MLGEFVHESRIYCIKSVLDQVSSDEKKINFKSLEDAKNFFAYVASNPFSREELLAVAKWLRPTSCRPPENCPKPSEQELLDMLCLMVYKDGLRGDYRLVELEAPPQALTFEECCVDTLRYIKARIKNTKVAGIILCIAQVHSIFASHTRTQTLISTLSAAYNTKQTNWKSLAEAMGSLKTKERKDIYNAAGLETIRHIEDNNQELRAYWERIHDAFA